MDNALRLAHESLPGRLIQTYLSSAGDAARRGLLAEPNAVQAEIIVCCIPPTAPRVSLALRTRVRSNAVALCFRLLWRRPTEFFGLPRATAMASPIETRRFPQ